MCLNNVYSKKRQKKILDKLPNTIEVYRVMRYFKDGYRSLFQPFIFKTGLNKAKGFTQFIGGVFCDDSYKRGFHSFKAPSAAKGWRSFSQVVVKCKIKKCWITSIGVQGDGVVFVTNKVFIPSPRTKNKIMAGANNGI